MTGLAPGTEFAGHGSMLSPDAAVWASYTAPRSRRWTASWR